MKVFQGDLIHGANVTYCFVEGNRSCWVSCDDGMEMFQGQLLSANFSDVSLTHLEGNLFIS